MGFCRACGLELAAGSGFCRSCEARTSVTTEPAEAGAASAAVPVSIAGESGAATSSNVMATNVAAALAYLAGFVTGIVFLLLDPYKSNSFVRFHAFQSIFFNVAWVAFWILWMILSAVLTPLTAGGFSSIAPPLMLIFTVAGFGVWIFLMYQAYQQKLFRLPVMGKFAAQHAGVRL